MLIKSEIGAVGSRVTSSADWGTSELDVGDETSNDLHIVVVSLSAEEIHFLASLAFF